MTFTNDDNPSVTNISEHVESYKQYLSKLKKGKASGISATFGNAADLLPAEALKTYKRGDAARELGEAVLPEGFDADAYRDALESMISQVHRDADEYGPVMTENGMQQVIAVYFEGNCRMLMLEDLSVIPADQAVVSQAVAQRITEEAPVAVAAPGQAEAVTPVPRETVAQPTQSSSPAPAAQSTQPVAPGAVVQLMQSAGPAQSPAPTAVAQPAAAAQPRPSQPMQAVPPADNIQDQPVLRVTAYNGMWLWDVQYWQGQPMVVETADGTFIQRTEHGNSFVMATPVPDQRFAKLEILDALLVDPSTGNLFWQGLGGARAGAMLNNGWQLEQFHQADGSDQFYATEPLDVGQAQRNRFQVFNMQLDAASGEVSYEMGNGALVSLRSRRLQS